MYTRSNAHIFLSNPHKLSGRVPNIHIGWNTQLSRLWLNHSNVQLKSSKPIEVHHNNSICFLISNYSTSDAHAPHLCMFEVNSFYRLLANLRFATSAHGRRGSIVSYITDVTAPEPTIFKKQCPTWWKVGTPLLLPGGKFHDAFNAQRNVQVICPIGPAQSSVCSLSDLESSWRRKLPGSSLRMGWMYISWNLWCL